MKIAAIDIGTNSTRLLIAEIDKRNRLKALHTALKTTRLGEGINGRCLHAAAIERTVRAVKNFVEYSLNYGVDDITIAATSAVRDASNKEEFARLIRCSTGRQLRILAGEEEAELSYRGVLAGLSGVKEGVAVIDVGGGSTEFSWRDKNQLCYASSNVGAVRMTEGDYDDQEIARLLLPVIAKVKEQQISRLVAVGGTATTLAAIIQKLEHYDPKKVHGFEIKVKQVEEVLALLESKTLVERKKIPGLPPDRADIIVAGVRIILIILKEMELNSFVVSEADMLWGLAMAAANVERKINTANQN